MKKNLSKVEVQFNLRVPHELKEKVKTSAFDNNRSINAEAILRLHDSFSVSKENLSQIIKELENICKQYETSPRREAIAKRLNQCLIQMNNGLSRKVKPARIARDLGEEYAEPMENFFEGKTEPSFKQLKILAAYFDVDPDWLLFGNDHESLERMSDHLNRNTQ